LAPAATTNFSTKFTQEVASLIPGQSYWLIQACHSMEVRETALRSLSVDTTIAQLDH
jgi:hypothetical protein